MTVTQLHTLTRALANHRILLMQIGGRKMPLRPVVIALPLDDWYFVLRAMDTARTHPRNMASALVDSYPRESYAIEGKITRQLGGNTNG